MPLRVVIVDPRAEVRLPLLLALEASGFDVAEAADDVQALDLASEQPVDVILAELELPAFNAAELIQAIRARCRCRPWVIAIVGDDSRDPVESLEMAQEIGADAVVSKPLNRMDIIRAITRARERPLQMVNASRRTK